MTPVVLRARVSTEGWKTCKNIGAGYEFLYPADWVVYSAGSYWTNPFDYPPNTDCTGFKSDILARRVLVPEDLKKEQLPIVRFDINHVSPKEKKTIDELFATTPSSSQERIIKEVYIIGGVKAFLYQLVTQGITFAPGWENVGTIMFMSPDQVVSIEITGPSVTFPTPDPILETILSTLHFLKK